MADIEMAARVLIECAPSARAGMVKTLLSEAHIADEYRKRLRKPHPQFGTGTLMSAATHTRWRCAARLWIPKLLAFSTSFSVRCAIAIRDAWDHSFVLGLRALFVLRVVVQQNQR
ncbi:MAG: DUF7742 family protein [Yoonia sp.]|uniref:DUF7742 family protein n=1 Tax=Yoonia sp. TaxID=2212373 RepID=UPI003EF39E5E